MKKENRYKDYYLGLDIGTNSVGAAVTDVEYNLLKYKGEPIWTSHIFEEGNQATDRRLFRTARRRTERKKQRVKLISDIFVPEIAKVDETFFIRRKESALFREDTTDNDKYIVFNEENFTDKDYYQKYPTIHHLIQDLIKDESPHDVRLVYMACAYLVAHRGHFLSEVSKENVKDVLDFERVYEEFLKTYHDLYDSEPWECDSEQLKTVLQKKATIGVKEKEFQTLLNDGKKFKLTEEDEIDRSGIVKLLSGGSIELGKLFPKIEFEEKVSCSFQKGEEEFLLVLETLDDEADLMIKMRNLFDWAALSEALQGSNYISDGKVKVYQQHGKDLQYLKSFIRKYKPEKYHEIFRLEDSKINNYVAYSYNVKSVKGEGDYKFKKAKKEEFCDYILKLVNNIDVFDEDKAAYDDMCQRLQLQSFLPKQVEGNNRVIPYQLYYYELAKILENAKKYLPFLSDKDEDGYSNEQKILSILEFRIPYFVGPLRKDNSEHAWIERRAEGKIYPWNFEQMIDLDRSEQTFIDRMTNSCTYIPGETVLPKYSLLYSKYTTLNEINNIKINGEPIPVMNKQGIYKLFEEKRKVSVKDIRGYLKANNLLRNPEDVLSGLDQTIKSSLKSFHDFKRLLQNGTLKEKEVEDIIEHLTYSEENQRMIRWLQMGFPSLADEDIKYISKLKYSDFGRMSKRFLSELQGCSKDTGELLSIIDTLWETNDNLMQILSDRYTFTEIIEKTIEEYYESHPYSMEDLLDEMYVSNAVKRSIYRTIDIVKDIQRVCHGAPKKIFVEMARGGGEKGLRTKSRRDQILDFYKSMDKQEIREISEQLEGKTDNELQSEVLFLYFLQLGKCAYTGQPLDISKLKTSLYNVDHIYPQSRVKDDSINNKVLVLSEENGAKGDLFPISAEIRKKMTPYWSMLKKNGLMSEEKYNRLTRNTSFSEEELMGFINRQLVETRQSTKAISTVLKSMFPETEIVYSKAGLVSEFRHEFGITKCRSVNDLHHAKDAYLNIVVGNVYHCRFTKNFYLNQTYSMKPKTLFSNTVLSGNKTVWSGEVSVAKVKDILKSNNIHYTRYAFMRHGGFFDQNPLKAKDGLLPRKIGLDPAKYGGYAKTTATSFLLVQYKEKGKKEAMIMPVELLYANAIFTDIRSATEYAKETLTATWSRSTEEITDITFPLGLRPLKVNTVLSCDGFRACITGKANGGQVVGLTSMMPLLVGEPWEAYIKKLESFSTKKQKNKNLILNETFDGISNEKNLQLYHILKNKIVEGPYKIPFSSQEKVLKNGEEVFKMLSMEEQVVVLMQLNLLLKSGRAGACDLTGIGGSKIAGTYRLSSKISAWENKFNNVYIVDASASGLYETKSFNLLELV